MSLTVPAGQPPLQWWTRRWLGALTGQHCEAVRQLGQSSERYEQLLFLRGDQLQWLRNLKSNFRTSGLVRDDRKEGAKVLDGYSENKLRIWISITFITVWFQKLSVGEPSYKWSRFQLLGVKSMTFRRSRLTDHQACCSYDSFVSWTHFLSSGRELMNIDWRVVSRIYWSGRIDSGHG